MRAFKTEQRLNKIISTATNRQFTLNVVLENIHDPHNVSAIFRTCDAVGVQNVSLLYYVEKFPKIGKKSSASAFKWVDKEKFKSVDECYSNLREREFKIYASNLSPDSENFYNIDFSEKCAVILGNEHRGVSEEAALKADKSFYIPMQGMVQSLNVSVAAAVILYEAQRQRMLKDLYNNFEINKMEKERLIEKWCEK